MQEAYLIRNDLSRVCEKIDLRNYALTQIVFYGDTKGHRYPSREIELYFSRQSRFKTVRVVIRVSLILCFSYAYDNKVTVRTGAASGYADIINSIMEQWRPMTRLKISE